MTAFFWALAFVLMCGTLGGSAVACVALSERGKNKRLIEAEKTKRTGMDNAWQLEQAKLQMGQLNSGPTEVSFELKSSFDLHERY